MLRENAKDIIALGFDPKKTLIFSDLEIMGGKVKIIKDLPDLGHDIFPAGSFYETVVRIQRHVSVHSANKLFGFDSSFSIGRI